jgi:hypothetical protein
MLWVFREWLAMLLSLGLRPLYYGWLVVLTPALLPLKLLDLVMVHVPYSASIASVFLYIGEKGSGHGQ